MAKLERRHQWIQDELTAALAGEVENFEVSVDGELVRVDGRIYVDGDPEEARDFLEALAAEAVPGHTVELDGIFIGRDVPEIALSILRRTSQTPQDVYLVRTDGGPKQLKAWVRQQDKFLGKKRNRLIKAQELLGKEGISLTAVPLGREDDASTLRTLPLVQEWLTPLLAGSPLSAGHVHAYKADSNGEHMHLVYDADVPPRALRKLATQIMRKTDISVSFEQRMSKARAREHIDARLSAVKWIERYAISFQDKGQAFVLTVDAEQSRDGDLRELVKALEAETQGRVIGQIDVSRDVMVSRLLDTFPEDGIVTGLKHVDESLYDIEAAIPFDHGNTRLQAWSDEVEATWGAKVMISEPFLRAPDVRYRHLLGEDKETIAKRYNLSVEFSEEVEAEARIAAEFDLEEEAKKPYRRDIRSTVVCSIDPERTRDLDDALSIEEVEPGVYEIGVHIADVAHFVPQGSALDQEALRRGFTCYLKEGEIPVLPFVIANQAASLHGGQDSLALSVFIRMDGEGQMTTFEVAKTVIHNHCRFSYRQAQAILDGKDPQHPYAWQILTLGALSKKLRATRKETGALDLNLDDDPEKESHQLIEEFMLLANEVVGRHLRERHPEGLCLYRTHPDVTEVSFEGLNKLSDRFRFGVTVRDQASMQRALEVAIKTPYFDIFRYHVGRTLEKAIYHVEQLGHGALAKDDYAHFTSPIRRYTDLIIHRLLEDILFSEARGGSSSYHKEDMRSAIDHLNMMEIRVDAASFESHRLSDLQAYDGARRTYTGRILSFMRGWVTVALHETDLRLSARYRDYSATDPMPVSINDEFTNQWYSLGDDVRVRTEGVNWASKNIKAQLLRG